MNNAIRMMSKGNYNIFFTDVLNNKQINEFFIHT